MESKQSYTVQEVVKIFETYGKASSYYNNAILSDKPRDKERFLKKAKKTFETIPENLRSEIGNLEGMIVSETKLLS